MKRILTFLTFTLCALQVLAETKYEIITETGAVWQHRNDVRINPSQGTYFEFDKLNQGAFLHYRLEAKAFFNEKHSVRLLFAPFQVKVSGPTSTAINFNGQTFSTAQDITVNYRFNSYRLGYAYSFYDSGFNYFRLGLTGKIRDAEIRVSQGATSSTYDNTGFVPLFYLAYSKAVGSSWQLLTDIDFAAAPQGRAIDATFKIRRAFGNNQSAGLGYRTLEGGADNDKVFTFSWFNYAVVDYAFTF